MQRRSMMKRVLLFSLFLTMVAAFNVPVTYADGMQDDVDQAVSIIQRFRDIPEKSIPREVLRDAKGLAIMTVIKAGFIFSGRGGAGVVIARTGKGWSGPSAIGTGGAGFGLQIGAQVTEFVFVLNTHEAVRAFSQGGNVQLGADLSVAAGPVGRTVEAGITPVAAVYAYSRSQGLFGGISLEGTVVATRDEANAKYYGRPVTPGEILSGKVKVPAGARTLQKALAKY
jgi:lipid-binding SYLF domain-containing protein